MKVVVGMSGGVDSSVAAFLLKEKGYDVVGVTIRTRDDGNAEVGCGAEKEIQDAKSVCDYLKIPHVILDGREAFSSLVMDYFTREYLSGRTPNPCVVCNRKVKLEMLYEYAVDKGIEKVATGHYAGVVQAENGRYAIKKAKTFTKDQTYALYRLSQEQLSRLVLPLEMLEKEEIRCIAEKAGIPVAHKAESMDICFVPDGDYAVFIEKRCGKEGLTPGNFVDSEGKILGRHKGIINYTVGQRKGLGIALGARTFVKEIRPETNEVVLTANDELFVDSLVAANLNFQSVETLSVEKALKAKIRYNHKACDATAVVAEDGRLLVRFAEPQRAVTPGQSVVLYDNDIIVGGGEICG